MSEFSDAVAELAAAHGQDTAAEIVAQCFDALDEFTHAGWKLHTTLRRRWSDGTEFTIRSAGTTGGYQLTVTHPAGLKAHSHHPTIDAAKDHAAEMMDSFPEAAKPRSRPPGAPRANTEAAKERRGA